MSSEPANVWMSTLRRGLAYHLLAGRFTACGRFVDDPPVRGFVLPLAEAVRDHGVLPCAACYPRE